MQGSKRSERAKARATTLGFWDRGLNSHDIAPIPQEERTVGPWRSTALFLACGTAAGWYGAGVTAVSAWGMGGFALVFICFALLMGLGAARLTRSSGPKGVGLMGLLRSAFGPRGATPVLLLWPLILALWLAEQARTTALWLERLLMTQMSTELQTTFIFKQLPFHGPTVLNAFLAFVLLGTVIVLALGGLERIGRAVATGLVVWAASGLPLLVLVFVSLHQSSISAISFWGSIESRPISTDDIFIVIAWLPLMVPILLSVPDWCRFQPIRRARSSYSAMFALPLAMTLSAVLGSLFGVAAKLNFGKWLMHPIADTAAFGGVRAATVGVVFTIGLWLLAPPLIGMYSQAQAWAAAWPRVLSYRAGVVLSALGTCAALVMLWYGHTLLTWTSSVKLSTSYLSLLLLPVIGIVTSDELLLRRHRLRSSELYHTKSHYAGALGITWSALGCYGLGLAFHPWLLPLWASSYGAGFQELRSHTPDRLKPFLEHPTGLAILASIACALLFVLTAPIERIFVRLLRRLFRALLKRLRSYRKKRRLAREVPKFVPISDDKVFSATNPNFKYPDEKS